MRPFYTPIVVWKFIHVLVRVYNSRQIDERSFPRWATAVADNIITRVFQLVSFLSSESVETNLTHFFPFNIYWSFKLKSWLESVHDDKKVPNLQISKWKKVVLHVLYVPFFIICTFISRMYTSFPRRANDLFCNCEKDVRTWRKKWPFIIFSPRRSYQFNSE